MNKDTFLRVNDVVQLNPDTVKNKAFAGCFMTVSEPKSFGAQGYVQSLGPREEMGGAAYYRASFEEMELIGKAIWSLNRDEEDL